MTDSPCATCPWRKENHGRKHADGWFTKKNLRRLWTGLRQGEMMICHATDPDSPDYGGEKPVKPGNERVCVGALVLQHRHMKAIERSIAETGKITAYRKRCGGPAFDRPGIMNFVGNTMGNAIAAGLAKARGGNSVRQPTEATGIETIGVPWDCPVSNQDQEAGS